MLSKAQISLITSLQHKKFRKQHGLFIVEGVKSVLEFLSSDYQVHSLYTTAEARTKMGNLPQKLKCITITTAEIQKISVLTNPQGVLALVHLPTVESFDWALLRQQHNLLLDDIQDPGNLGTIIRTAEWFGINHIVCSMGTVDAFNPKVVQATMGSLARVKISYTPLAGFIDQSEMPTFGALLEGKSIYKTDFGNAGLIIMGNEGNGISDEIVEKIDHPITIPRIGQAESLNVAVASTIFCSEIARQKSEHG
ncbi:TrmH family RNA methyltransferase [Sphingobacterium corticibacterium]|uniref:RNA methyltransferase n=1 Tax=Sphingobacterium corticibacterium TaxID=2484746 RepID=A0A4Q6Y0P7_9SPHI|nr:TrmH family RNA methyltransferase [Sphingobacterium corticibacterium]RZF62789.1 RNA methyltransferase [Sphingobacterium corticibacterium]